MAVNKKKFWKRVLTLGTIFIVLGLIYSTTYSESRSYERIFIIIGFYIVSLILNLLWLLWEYFIRDIEVKK